MNETNDFPTLPSRPERPDEAALHGWFAEQRLKSIDNLETAARQIITLCTTLLGLLLGLMALAAPNLPAHMGWSGVQWLSGLGVVALLVALLCGLSVVVPWRTAVNLQAPGELQATWEQLLARKSQGLRLAILFFAGAVVCLTAVILIALYLL
jgi:uncharacterized membrane protein YcjF (UPF0283 family)